MRKPMFKNQATAVGLGAVLFAAGSWCLYDAWERRGQPKPLLARPFAWW